MSAIGTYFKTAILFAILTALLVLIGYFIGGRQGVIIFFVISLAMNFFSYWFSDKVALQMSGAKPLGEREAPEVYEMVRDLTSRMNIPMPRIYITSDMQPNAFATGRNPENSAICFTKGILQILDRSELRGVIAHELAHIKHRDVLIATIAAVMAGTISSIANIGMYSSRDRENSNPIAGLILLILAPIAAGLIQLAVSRSREYEADEESARATGEPMELADALMKISSGVKQIPMDVNPALSSLYIENPFKGNRFKELFSTHPSVENRVAQLHKMSLSR